MGSLQLRGRQLQQAVLPLPLRGRSGAHIAVRTDGGVRLPDEEQLAAMGRLAELLRVMPDRSSGADRTHPVDWCGALGIRVPNGSSRLGIRLTAACLRCWTIMINTVKDSTSVPRPGGRNLVVKKKRLGPKTTHNTRPLSDETLSRTV